MKLGFYISKILKDYIYEKSNINKMRIQILLFMIVASFESCTNSFTSTTQSKIKPIPLPLKDILLINQEYDADTIKNLEFGSFIRDSFKRVGFHVRHSGEYRIHLFEKENRYGDSILTEKLEMTYSKNLFLELKYSTTSDLTEYYRKSLDSLLMKENCEKIVHYVGSPFSIEEAIERFYCNDSLHFYTVYFKKNDKFELFIFRRVPKE